MDTQIDIIIPVHDNLDWVNLCVDAIRSFTFNPFLITLVNNDSRTQKMLDYLNYVNEAHADTQVVHLQTNKSYASAINAGIRATEAPLVAFMNSDVIVQPGWDRCFFEELSNSRIGMVGARGACSGPQASMPRASVVDFLIFMCVCTRRDVIEEVGLLDEDTCPNWGGGEDLDYSWTIRKAGYELEVSQAAVFHAVSKTYESAGISAEQKQRLEAGTLMRLKGKWGDEFMRNNMRNGVRIAIGVLTPDERGYNQFWQSLMYQGKGGSLTRYSCEVYMAQRCMPDVGRELICADILSAATPFDYVWFVDSDMVFPQNTLHRLASHGKDVVGAVAYRRKEPYEACVFAHSRQPGGGFFTMNGIEHTGLVPVDALGFGCILISTKVLRGLERPWFSFGKYSEDVNFTWNAKQAGFGVFCDTDLVVGHLGNNTLIDERYVQAYMHATGKK